MAEENEKTFRLKHPELWIIAFVILVVTASASFAFTCANSNREEKGLYEIVPISDSEVKFYGADFSFYYYCDGEMNVTIEKNNVRKVYSDKLKEIYAYLDEDNTYTSYISVASINEHPNEIVSIGPTLYSMLEDAYKRSSLDNNYSIFATPLYSFWYQQFAMIRSDREARDPVNNEESVTYLKEVADFINNKEHIDLSFLGEGKVKLSVSEEYQKYRDNKGIDTPYLSFNILKNSYILQTISDFLSEKEINKGFIITSDGSVVQLKNSPNQTYSIYSVKDLTLERAGDIDFTNPLTSGDVIRHFNLNNTSPVNYYYMNKDGVTYFRSLYLDIKTGLENNFLLSSGIYSKDLNILDNATINNALVPCNTIEEINTYLTSHDKGNTMIVINLVDNPKNIYVSNLIKENIKLNDKLDYNLNIIKED